MQKVEVAIANRKRNSMSRRRRNQHLPSLEKQLLEQLSRIPNLQIFNFSKEEFSSLQLAILEGGLKFIFCDTSPAAKYRSPVYLSVNRLYRTIANALKANEDFTLSLLPRNVTNPVPLPKCFPCENILKAYCKELRAYLMSLLNRKNIYIKQMDRLINKELK